MAFFNKYPYLDLHELNLDYVLNSISDLKNKIGTGTLETTAQTIIGAINELKTRIDNIHAPTEQKTTINETVDGKDVTLEITRYGSVVTILSYYQLPSQTAKYQYQAYMTNTIPSWALPSSTTAPNGKVILYGYSGAMNTGTVAGTDVFIPNAYTIFAINTTTGQIALNVAKCESTIAPTGTLRDCYGSLTYRL